MAVALCGSTAAAPMTIAEPLDTTTSPSRFRSAEDGWLDVSGFLDEKYGFLPVVIPITEPAVGYGAFAGLSFISKPLSEARAGFGRPNITVVGSLGTENGSWGLAVGDVRHWLEDRLQTQVGFTYLSANLDFHGIGEDRTLDDHPLSGSRQFTITTKTELEGFIGGGGLTLAGGYRQFFVMADVNYSQTDMGFDDRFRALIASARAGWNGKVGPVPLRLWAGGAYWDTKNTAEATTDVAGVGSVRFEADQGPKHPWNAVVGVSSAVHRHFELFAEYGFNPGDVTFFAGGLTVRF
jgi:hypothetical protein